MQIGLDSIKGNYKHWRKQINFFDLFNENKEEMDEIFTSKEPSNHKYLYYEDEEANVNYWSYWKRQYSILR